MPIYVKNRPQKFLLLALLQILLFGQADVHAQDSSSGQSLLRRIEGIEKRLTNIEQKMGISSARPELYLSEDPTPQEVEQYIRDIISVSAEQEYFSVNDVQVEMLKSIGPAHVATLLSMTRGRTDGISFVYVPDVVGELATNENKEAIIEALSENPYLLPVIVNHGWLDAAASIIVNGVNSSAQLPHSWIMAAIELRDPTAFDALLNRLGNSGGEEIVAYYLALAEMPEILPELDSFVAERWDSISDNEIERRNWLIPAAATGNKAAMDQLVESLGPHLDRLEAEGGSIVLSVVRSLLGVAGSGNEIKSRYQENLGNWVFSNDSRKYEIKP